MYLPSTYAMLCITSSVRRISESSRRPSALEPDLVAWAVHHDRSETRKGRRKIPAGGRPARSVHAQRCIRSLKPRDNVPVGFGLRGRGRKLAASQHQHQQACSQP